MPAHTCRPTACDDANVGASPTPSTAAVAVAAHLRVYEPLTAFPAAQRAAWRTHLSPGVDPVELRAEAVAGERTASLRAATALPPRVVTDADLRVGGALVLTAPGAAASSGAATAEGGGDIDPLICPLDLGWRSLLAVEELRETVPLDSLRAFLPDAAVAAAMDRLADLTRPQAGPHVRSARWHVPLAWFTAFRPDQLVASAADGSELDEPEGSTGPAGPAGTAGPAEPTRSERSPELSEPGRQQPVRSSDHTAPAGVRYLAPMADARRCVARALAAIRRTPTGVLPVADLEEFGRWLEEFHPKSMVELDCGALANVAGAAWAAGQSVRDVAGAFADLRAGRDDAALRTLRAVRARWAAVQAYEHAS